MVEREQDEGRGADVEGVVRPAGLEAATPRDVVSSARADAAEDERHRRVMTSAERVMRKHRNVFAALAK